MNGRRILSPGRAFLWPFSLFVAGRLLKRADETVPLAAARSTPDRFD